MNKRKFRVRDNTFLFETLQKAIQLTSKVDALCIEKECVVEDLDKSLLPTHILYDIALCYEAMYDKLLEEELVTCGYPKQDKNTH